MSRSFNGHCKMNLIMTGSGDSFNYRGKTAFTYNELRNFFSSKKNLAAPKSIADKIQKG
ncbi:hypothetical protein [Peribacillus simplex]|uniref:hypothetical protein n=1 Tax=Peribacillus simplex TaxID=1478 RepID=UPI003D289873